MSRNNRTRNNILTGAEREKILASVSHFTNQINLKRIDWNNPYGDGKSRK